MHHFSSADEVHELKDMSRVCLVTGQRNYSCPRLVLGSTGRKKKTRTGEKEKTCMMYMRAARFGDPIDRIVGKSKEM